MSDAKNLRAFGACMKAYISITMTRMTDLTIDELKDAIENEYEAMHSSLSSPHDSFEDFFSNIWRLDVLKLILNRKEYDMMTKPEKKKKLLSYRKELKNFFDEWNKKNDSSLQLPPIAEMVKIIKDEVSLLFFVVKWGLGGENYLLNIMSFEVRLAFYMIAWLDYDCKF